MRPIELLKTEHTAVKLMLKILEEVCARAQDGQQISSDDLDSILEFITVFVDKCHHAKEEELLFPAMERAGVPRQPGPLGMMFAEHKMGRDYVKGMIEAVASYKAGNRGALSEFARKGRQYIALLVQHIEKEDNVLYPMADGCLSADMQEVLVEQFEAVERERVGPGKHEEFHKLLKRLRDVYLTGQGLDTCGGNGCG